MTFLVRILPGVEIRVVKEIVPQQLHPSGVVGLIGTAERGPVFEPTPTTSYREFIDKFGSNTEYTLIKDARLAFLNGVFEVFAVRVEGENGKAAEATLNDSEGNPSVLLRARTPGPSGNNIEVIVRKGIIENTVIIEVSDGRVSEAFENLTMDSSSSQYLVSYINKNSKLIQAEDISKLPYPRSTPVPIETRLSGGVAGTISKRSFEKALECLELEPDIDLVMVCDSSDPEVHALVDAHCKNMSRDAMNRIGIGTVASGESVKDIVKRTEALASDRFVLVAPYGCAGAVAGLISHLPYYESPTFKAVTGIASLERRYTPSELMELLKAGILALEMRRGRGIIVEKGITTSKEQISVMRIADHAVRGVKNVAENFIGTLNSPGGRLALREKITEFLLSMEREGAIVPSVDGKKPPFIVDVYCSEMDFAQGIVRVDVAVRPVRAMDYIYTTITVEI
ncbi:MAG: phage tail sheath subtilisin-like domain-containing protein [Candidatus Methanomethylicia archaeon]